MREGLASLFISCPNSSTWCPSRGYSELERRQDLLLPGLLSLRTWRVSVCGRLDLKREGFWPLGVFGFGSGGMEVGEGRVEGTSAWEGAGSKSFVSIASGGCQCPLS